MKHIVVIGGGVVGVTTAWALAEDGHQVTLLERESGVGMGASYANGAQLSYRYVSPLADEGVPLKGLRWLFDPDGPLRFKPELSWNQWAWMASFLHKCRGPVNRRATARLLALGEYSRAAFARLQLATPLPEIAWRAPGKLVAYRKPAEFARVAARLRQRPSEIEHALSHAECVALEPALAHSEVQFAGGIFTEGEAVADCYQVCVQLTERLKRHGNFRALVQGEAQGFRQQGDQVVAVQTSAGEIEADGFVIAAGVQSRALAKTVGISLPIYPLKGYSLTAPIGPEHKPPVLSVTDFEKKIVYAQVGDHLRVAAMVDLVGEDDSLNPARIASLHRSVNATFPKAADYASATPWAGLRPATPSGAPILGATPLRNLWLNVGHGALGFTFSFGTAHVLAALIAGRASPIALDGLQLKG